MFKNLSKIFLLGIVLSIAIYIGVFIGRTSSSNITFIQDHKNILSNEKQHSLDGKLDLNQATTDELAQIPGVTQEVANEIVNYRNKYGKYYHVKELMDIEGISRELYNEISSYVTVNN